MRQRWCAIMALAVTLLLTSCGDDEGAVTVDASDASGGASSTGGNTTGGNSSTAGATTGGSSTGGSATGGAVTGGATTGGSSTGGSTTGGSITGGAMTGGSTMGGATTGGAAMMGGAMTGGSPMGGTMTGGGWMSAADEVVMSCSNPTVGARLDVGGKTLYFGYDQASSNNQNPVVAIYDGTTEIFCRDYETGGPDSRTVAATWDGGNVAYITFTTDGGGSQLDQAANGWLNSYAPGAISGGGPKVAMIASIDTTTGDVIDGTFVIAVLSSNRVNTMRPDGALSVLPNGNIEFRGIASYAPMNPDRSRMDCMGPSGFAYTAIFPPDFSQPVCASVAVEMVTNNDGQLVERSCMLAAPCP